MCLDNVTLRIECVRDEESRRCALGEERDSQHFDVSKAKSRICPKRLKLYEAPKCVPRHREPAACVAMPVSEETGVLVPIPRWNVRTEVLWQAVTEAEEVMAADEMAAARPNAPSERSRRP